MIHVAVGVLVNHRNQVLITKRCSEGPYGNLWEFPGGKIEAGETVTQALHRELQEELGVRCTDSQFLSEYIHQYDDCTVCLHVFIVSNYEGQISCKENQQGYQWVQPTELSLYEFPEGNKAIIRQLVDLEAQQ